MALESGPVAPAIETESTRDVRTSSNATRRAAGTACTSMASAAKEKAASTEGGWQSCMAVPATTEGEEAVATGAANGDAAGTESGLIGAFVKLNDGVN